MNNPYPHILKFLQDNNIDYELIEHEPVFTSKQAGQIRGVSESQGAKSLLLKADKDFLLVIIPGNRRLDSKKLKQLLALKNLRFALPLEVVEVMGCEIGSCYPFGNLIDVEMLVDTALSWNEYIFFNPGVHNKSIKMKWEDYKRIVNPQMHDLSTS